MHNALQQHFATHFVSPRIVCCYLHASGTVALFLVFAIDFLDYVFSSCYVTTFGGVDRDVWIALHLRVMPMVAYEYLTAELILDLLNTATTRPN